MSVFSFNFILMILIGGGGEVMDYIDTQTYWQQQGIASPTVEAMATQLQPPGEPDAVDAEKVAALIAQLGDPLFAKREEASKQLAAIGPGVLPHLEKALDGDDAEITLRAQRLIATIKGADQQGDPHRVRRLMAIRTLGELEDEKAIAVLTPILASDRPFEADYAKHALAKIRGQAIAPRVITREQLDTDLTLLPRDVGVVAQQTGLTRQVTLDQLLKSLPQMPDGTVMQPEQAKQQINEMMSGFIALTGNTRLDALTLGVASDFGPNQGFIVGIARGQYDREAMIAILVKTKNFQATEHDGITVYHHRNGPGVIFIDDQRLAFVAGPRETFPKEAERLAQAVKAGRGTLGENQAMAKLIAAADRTSPFWAVAKLSDSYKATPFTRALETASLSTRQLEDGSMDLTLTAQGEDAEQVAATVTVIEQQIEQTREKLKEVARDPMGSVVKPFQQMLESVKVKQDSTTLTITAQAPGDLRSMMLAQSVGVWVWSVRQTRERPMQAPGFAPEDTGF